MSDAPRVAAPTASGPLTPRALDDLLERVSGVRTVAWLHVSDGLSERCVFFPAGGLRLSSIGPRRGRTVTDALLARADLSPRARSELEQMRVAQREAVAALVARSAAGEVEDEAEARQFSSANEPGESELEALVARHDLRQAYLDVSRAVVKDELLDLAAWDGARFEYREANPPGKIFSPELEATKVSLGVKDLLNQVRQANRDWQKLAPRLGSTARTMVAWGEPDEAQPTGVAAAILSGVRRKPTPLADVLVAARRAGFDVVEGGSALLELVAEGTLTLDLQPKPPSPEEARKRALGEIDAIEAALALMVQQLAARRRLAEACVAVGDLPKAVENLRQVGDALAAEGQTDEAIGVLERVLQLSPDAFDARERIARLLEQAQRVPQAVQAWLALARQLTRLNLWNRAIASLRRAIKLEPRDPDNRRRLVDVLRARGREQEAARELEELATLYESLGQPEAALACWAQLAELVPQHARALAALSRAAGRGRSAVAGLAVVALLAALVALGAWQVHTRYQALVAWDAARAKALELARAGSWDDARREVTTVVALHEIDPARVEALGAAIDAFQDDAGRIDFAAAEEERAAGRIAAAQKALRELRRAQEGRRWGERAAASLQEIEQQVARAEGLAKELEEQVQAGHPAQALELARELARQFPWSEAAQRTTIPLEVITTPSDAGVTLDGAPWPAHTPCLVRGPLLSPWKLDLTLDRHLPWSAQLDLLAAPPPLPLTVQLVRAPRWSQAAQGPLRESPVPLPGGGLVVVGEDPHVYAFDGTGEPRWVLPLPPFSACAGRPAVAGGLVVVVDTTGSLRGLDARSGEVRWQRPAGDEQATLVGAAEALVVLSAGDQLLGLDVASGEERWRTPLGAQLAAPARMASPQRVMAATSDGRVVLIQAATGKVESRLTLGGRACTPPLATSIGCVVGTEDGQLRVVWRGEVWAKTMPAPLSAAPALSDEMLFVSSGTKLFGLDLRDGFQRWERDLGVSLGAPAAEGGRVYVGGSDGLVRALVASNGEVRWTARAAGEVRAAPLLERGNLFVVSEGMDLLSLSE